VEDGRFKVTDFWMEVCIHVVYPGALEAHGQAGRIFRNANTPEDYERLRASP
jgi:molybdopterin-guanine dinucleotide biosynthesis protein A